MNNNQVIQNVYKLIVITKTYKFNLLFKVVIVHMKILYRPQKEAICFIYSLIELLNLSKI